MIRQKRSLLSALILFAVLLASCQPKTAAPTTDINAVMTEAVASAMARLATPTFTVTPAPTATAVRTPPVLPTVFQTNLLDPLNTPHTYITDSCQQLKDKWTSTNAVPGTVVMVVMFHTIEKATETAANPMNVGSGDFKRLMNNLHDMGFQAINATQLADFLDYNTKIPARSVVLIQDDRHAAENFDDWFRPYWKEWGWPVVTAWISWEDSIRTANLQDNVNLEAEGWVDHESHGYIHNINMTDDSTDEFIRTEFEKSIADLQQNFNKTPVAIIWPGGGFGVRPVQFARQYGYRIGFTVNPRGPIMFNWVPLADVADPGRPSWIPEGSVNDPRLVLPRYWPNQVIPNLDVVRQIGDAATAYAQQNKATELEYYDIVCAPTLGPMP